MYARILLAVLAPTLFVLTTDLASAQVVCIRGPNGAVVCGPPAQRSEATRQRGPGREFDYRTSAPRFANRGGRERIDDRRRSQPSLETAPQESELERARAARRFYSERLREAMLHEQELQRGRRLPQERLGPAGRRHPAGVAPGYAPPRYTDRAPPRYADRAPPYREARREPFPPRNIQRYPGQQRMDGTRLSVRERIPAYRGRTPPRTRSPYTAGAPAYRGPQSEPAGRPPMSREEALERLRRHYNLGAPDMRPPAAFPGAPGGFGPNNPIGTGQGSPFGPPPQFPAEQAPGRGT